MMPYIFTSSPLQLVLVLDRGLFSTFKTNITGCIINLPFCDKGCALMWGQEILTWQWLLPGHGPKSFPVHRWWLSSLNRGTPRLRVPRVAPLRSYNKHVSTEIPPRPQARRAGFSLACFIASFVFGGKQNCSERRVGLGIIAGLHAGRSALQRQLWNHNWRQQSSVTVFL